MQLKYHCIIINNLLRRCFFPRYVELNTRCSEGYRRYSSDVPKYLHNKPRPFVNHCRQHIISAVEVEPQHIKEVCNGIEDGQFQVQSQSSNTWYSLSFGAGDVMPRCSCPDFCHTGLLCKHFFAIFDHYPKWQWGSLPEKYRENPHLSLDREHVFADFTKYKSGEENHNIQTGQDVPGNQQDGQAGVPNQKVKGIESQIRQEAVTCREKLKGLTSLTYNIEDVSALKELNSSLEMLLIKFTTFQTTDEKENSLQMQTLIKKQSGKKQLKSSFGNYLPLPVRPKKKRFHNRVGEFASMMQKHYKVQIPVDGVSVKTSKTKSSLKRKKELHKESKHPSPAKKQRTEEQNHLVQNETKTSNDPSAAQERTDTSPTNTQHPNSEDQPLQKEIFSSAVSNSQSSTVSNSPSSAVSNSPSTTVSNSQLLAVSNSPSSTVSNSPSSAVGNSPSSKVSNSSSSVVSNSPSSKVSNSPSSAVSNSPSSAVGNSPSSKVSNSPSSAVGNIPSSKVSNSPSSAVSNSPSSTVSNSSSSAVSNSPSSAVSNSPSSAVSNSPSSAVSNGQFGDSSTPSSKSTPGPILIDENSPDPPSWLTIENCDPEDPNYKLNLYIENKTRILQKTTWLSDSEIHAGQMLLKRDYPFMDGLCDPAIKGSLVVPATSEFIQIINTGNHWVCLSTISTTSSPDTVKIFDSLYQNTNSTAVEHACRMLMYPGDKVTFINEKVQRQVGGSDCGLFSLAFATDLCHGIDPTNQNYNQGSMRQHYVNCIENGAMSPFPKTEKRVPRHLGSIKSSVAIYCVCRLPYDREEYVQCSNGKCKKWYHPTCVKIPAWAINSNRKWRCNKCKDDAKVTSSSRN